MSHITFKTVKTGKPDLKKDGGQVRGRHAVAVTLSQESYREALERDLQRLASADLTAIKDAVMALIEGATESAWDQAMFGLGSKKGLLISLNKAYFAPAKETKYTSHPEDSRLLVCANTQETYLRGRFVSEEVIVRDPMGDARKAKKTMHTQIKDAVARTLGFESVLWRTYKVDSDQII
jgi:hypothetical protein